jgi:hypothetical protein
MTSHTVRTLECVLFAVACALVLRGLERAPAGSQHLTLIHGVALL